MAPSLGGISASPQPDPEASRTIISHRAVEEDYSSDSEEDVVNNPGEAILPNGAITNGNQVILASSKTALMEAAVEESSSDEDNDGADLADAAAAAVADVPDSLVEMAIENLGGGYVDLDVEVNADVYVRSTVPETQESATVAGTTPAAGRGRVGTKSASATPAVKKSATPKSKSKSKPAPPKPQAKVDADQVEFAGQVGPDTSVDVEGETQWEIERIAGSENDGKTLLVKWKGWKGYWEESRDNIADSAPALVEAFEKKQKEGKGGRAGKKAAAAAGTATGAKGKGRGKGKRGPAPKSALGPKTKGAKVTKKAAAPAPARAGAKRGRKPKSAGATSTSPAKKSSTSTPRKAAPTKKAAVADAVPKIPAKSPATTKRGPPKKRAPVPAKASAPKGTAKTGAGVKKNIKTAPTKKAVKVVEAQKSGGRRGRPRKA